MRVVNLDDHYSWHLAPDERICTHDNCPNVDNENAMLYAGPGTYYCRYHADEHAYDLPKGSPE